MCNVGEDFSVNFDVGFLEGSDESTVVHPEFSDCSVDMCLPERALVSLLVFAVSKGVSPSDR